MVLPFLSLFFAGPINTSELLDLNFYQLVNVKPNASEHDILRSYQRFRAQRAKASSVPRARSRYFERTAVAFDVLGNPDSRALYDFAGTDFLNFTGFQIMGYQSDITIRTLKRMVGTLPNEMEHYGGMLVYPIQFDIVDFLTGAERTVTIIRFAKCECPKGKPRCDQCLQQRFLEQIIKERVVLPPGAVEYHRIIAKGLGDAPGGRGAADVIFVAYMKPDPHFRRKGADVLTEVNVSLADVITGKPIVVENFDGEKTEISTEDGIQDGQEKRIKGRGLPLLMEPAKRGDFVVTIHIQFPERLAPEQVKAIAEKLPDDPAIYE
jgi:DnaJ-class molecular chaperone